MDAILENIISRKLKVGIFSSAVTGGACQATTRVHKALMMNSVASSFITRDKSAYTSLESNYVYLSPELGLRWELLQHSNQIHPGNTIFTVNEPNVNREELNRLVANLDIINVQWTARFLTAEDIGFLSNLNKPLIITVRDMHPLTGGCHFFHGCEEWKENCENCPQIVGDTGDIPTKVLAIKKRYWNMKNITFVALSKHTKKIITQSSLYENNRIEIIENPIDLQLFYPTQKKEARTNFDIRVATPLLFYMPSYGSTVKGADEFKNALMYIKKKYPDFHITLLLAGSATERVSEEEFVFPVMHLGKITDNSLLAKAYSAADATIIPSLEETFSNTAAESISCGTPIIGFKTGAIPEIAGDGLRGESVSIGDIEALGEAIYRVLNIPISEKNCREYAEENFSFKDQGRKYADLFESLKNQPVVNAMVNPKSVPTIDQNFSVELYTWEAKALQRKEQQVKQKDQQLKQKDQQLKQKDQQLKQKDQQLKQKEQQLKGKQSKINTLRDNRWYRFGKLSRKEKVWIIGKVVSKKIKLYWVLQPIVKQIKILFRK